ncbi:MAG: radical SAM protein [archaeon]|nr:radical SAM protein [archaeon]
MSRFLSVVIKPTLACNMACRHCYHTSEELTSEARISFDRLERLFNILSKEYDSVWFVWHGGEPLEMPFVFYKKVLDMQEKIFGPERYGNTIQTNGLKLDRKFINFCKEKKVNIGISHEGPYDGILRENGEKIEKQIIAMSDKERVFSVNSTISRDCQDKQLEIYRHFRDIGAAVSMVPVLPIGCTACHPEFVPDADAYIKSSIAAFDEWLTDTTSRIPLLPHYQYVLSALGTPQESDCAHSSCLTKWLCMYPNGDLYPCAKPCPSSMKLGNIDNIKSIGDCFRTEGFVNILQGTIVRRQKCQSCDLFKFCQGGCSIDALNQGGIENNGGDSCRIYREIFTHIKDAVSEIINEKKDLTQYNAFIRDAILGKLVNPALGGVI